MKYTAYRSLPHFPTSCHDRPQTQDSYSFNVYTAHRNLPHFTITCCICLGLGTSLPKPTASKQPAHESQRRPGRARTGRACGRRDPRVGGPACATQVAMRQIQDLLVVGVGVNRGHETALDPHRVVQHLCHRRKAVRGAGGVGDNLHVRAVVLVVHAHHKHRGVSRGGGDDNLLGSSGVNLVIHISPQ